MGNFTNECGANNPLAQDVYFTQSLLDYLFYNGVARACVGYTYLIGDAPGQRSLSRGSVAEHLGLIWAAGVLPTPRARTCPTTNRHFTFITKKVIPSVACQSTPFSSGRWIGRKVCSAFFRVQLWFICSSIYILTRFSLCLDVFPVYRRIHLDASMFFSFIGEFTLGLDTTHLASRLATFRFFLSTDDRSSDYAMNSDVH